MNLPSISALIKRLKSSTSDQPNRHAKYERELAIFSQVEDVHALPEIFHYWSHKYLRPKFIEMGIRGIYEFFYDAMCSACDKSAAVQTFVSIGSGHSEIEIQVVEMLVASGRTNFTLDCMDINQHMLHRGYECAVRKQLNQYLRFVTAEASGWDPKRDSYSVVMAHQSLHHIVELELLFEKVKKAIGKEGVFLTSDIIGRNGHMRWPEAMQEIDTIWREMPDRYKYNHALKRFEKSYENWDCSTDGFEGIRAQEILGLLSKNFSFEMFLGFGNLIDLFVDRGFGPNFDTSVDEDQRFIDKIAELDDRLIEAGVLKPTHIVATMRATPTRLPKYYKHLTPEFCIRR